MLMGFQWLLLSLLKLLFFIKYFSLKDIALDWVLLSIKFDAAALAYYYAPFLLLFLFPLQFFISVRVFRALSFLWYGIGTVVWLSIACIDLPYFSYTSSRITFGFLAYMQSTNEAFNQIPFLVLKYSWAVLLFFLLTILSAFFYKKATVKQLITSFSIGKMLVSIGGYGFLCGCLLLIGRGGVNLRPMSLLDAYAVDNPAHATLALNAPYTFVRTYGKVGVSEGIPENYSSTLFHHHLKKNSAFKSKNIVLIVLESFSNDYFGKDHLEFSYTPFLDSLKQHSLVFENTYANGRRSIEALPAILSSIPSLMPVDYITSIYAGNNIESLASILKSKGYFSSFYHGGHNGTMSFNTFVQSARFDAYVGRTEYPGPVTHENEWGVHDHYFMNYWLESLQKTPEPFLSTFFTLTSHQPYTLPAELSSMFKTDSLELPILKTIRYTDYAVAQFMKEAKLQNWFDHSIFVFTADHCAPSSMKVSENMHEYNYHIPFFIYDPSSNLSKKMKDITSQIDIMPTILDYLSFDKPFYSMGVSALDTAVVHMSSHYAGGMHHFYANNSYMSFNKEVNGKYVLQHKSPISQLDTVDYERYIENNELLYFSDYIHLFNNAMVQNKLSLE